MKLIKIVKKVLIVVLCIFLLSTVFYKLQGTKVHWLKLEAKKIGENNGEFFIIQNPPSTKEELIELIEKMNDTLNLNSIAKNKKNYTQYFYKETFNLTRFYKSYYTAILGNYVDITNDINGDFDEEYLVSYNYKYQNNENDSIEWCPIYPYYAFYKDGSIDYEYYPKGLKGKPNLHWKKY